MARSRHLKSRLTVRSLTELANEATFERGEAYQLEGRVRDLRESGDTISATVCGSEDYETSIRATERSLTYSCSCPAAEDGDFCKHCVALGLEWLAGAQSEAQTRAGRSAGPVDAYLASLDQSDLIAIVKERMGADREFRRIISLRAAAASGSAKELNKSIDRALKSSRFIDYRRMREYARGAGEVIAQIQKVLSDGNPVLAIELSEHALKAMEVTANSCDDSDGHLNEIFGGLHEIHLEAATQARPEPLKFAKHLFEWEMRSDWEVFSGSAENYAEVLGDDGLAEYERLIAEEWAALPVLGPGDKQGYDNPRYRITTMVKSLARASGDMDRLIDIHKRDLSTPYQFLQIAEMYLQGGKVELAIEWAKKGLDAFPNQMDGRLKDFLVNRRAEQGDEFETMELAWEVFSRYPTFDRYVWLWDKASPFGSWEKWRDRAFELIRSRSGEQGSWRYGALRPQESSELVKVFLWEGDAEAAWAEAKAGGCSPDLWMQLAEMRVAEHPLEAAGVYRLLVHQELETSNNAAYERAASLLPKIQALEPPEGFRAFLTNLRTKHKAKRNFMKLLEAF